MNHTFTFVSDICMCRIRKFGTSSLGRVQLMSNQDGCAAGLHLQCVTEHKVWFWALVKEACASAAASSVKNTRGHDMVRARRDRPRATDDACRLS